MTSAFHDIEKLEADLWAAADELRANSKLTSSDYFLPVLGVIFLRHAANRFEEASRQIAADQASGRMPKRKVQPEDYLRRRALYLPEPARYDWIMEQAATRNAAMTISPGVKRVSTGSSRKVSRQIKLCHHTQDVSRRIV